MNEIKLRNVDPSDYPPIISVVDHWWGGRRMADMLPKLFFVHFRATSFVAEQDGKIVGFVIGFVSQAFPNEAYIHFVGVHPDCRRLGVARMLYDRFFAAASNLGCSAVRCVTSPINKNSIDFHRRMGFSVEAGESNIGGTPFFEGYDGKGEDRVLFYKLLRPKQ